MSSGSVPPWFKKERGDDGLCPWGGFLSEIGRRVGEWWIGEERGLGVA
jgi:hypothetical protein